MDPLEWSKKFEVLSLSRLYLHSLGFSLEGINSLTDEDMQYIADDLQNGMLISFAEDVRFIVACEIVEKLSTGGPDECKYWN